MSTENNVYQFVLGWVLVITLLTFVNKTRLGHVIIYYTLMLMILFILLAEYKQLAPILSGVQTIAQFNAATEPTAKNVSQQGNI